MCSWRVDAAYSSHTDHLTIRAQDPGNPPVVTLDLSIGDAYSPDSNANGYQEDIWAPIVWIGANNVRLENIEIGTTNGAFSHLAGQGSGIEFNDCQFTVVDQGPADNILGMGRNGNWANPDNTPDAFNEWTFRNCYTDMRSQASGNVESEVGFTLFDAYYYPLGAPHIADTVENGFLLCESCIFNDLNDEAFTFRAHDDLIWEDGCPHTGAEDCQIYEHECRYNCAPRFWTFQDCYFLRNREDELYRVRGMTGDVLYDRCVFENCSINEGETHGSIFSFEDRHRTWFVNITMSNCILANNDTELNAGSQNHLINILAAYQSSHNPAMPNPSVHIVNNTFFNTKGAGAMIYFNGVSAINDPELAAPDDTAWPDDADGFGIIRPSAVPEVIMANNIFYGSNEAPLGTLFELSDRHNFQLVNNNFFGLADANTDQATSEVGSLSVNPLFANTVLTQPANAGDPLLGEPFLAQNPDLSDAGDDAAYVASGAGASDIDGDARQVGIIDIGAQELGTPQEISGVENWELMDWNKF